MTSPNQPPPSFFARCEAFGFEIPEECLEMLGAYLAFLLETNEQMNLTGTRDPEEAWLRHVFDSLTLVPFCAGAHSLVDVGSGGGFPAIPIAIACPDLDVVMIESTGKKCRFLEECVRRFDLSAEVRQGRAEVLGHDPALREAFDLATARGLAPLPVLLEYLLPFVHGAGTVLAMKGRSYADELRRSSQALQVLGADEPVVHQVDEDGDMVILEIPKDRRTPPKYPRATGTPKASPL